MKQPDCTSTMISSKSSRFVLLLSFAIAGLLLLVGCDSLFDSDEDTLVEDARIVFGENIEGVQIGDDSLAVVQKLGTPSGIGIGDFEGWIFFYEEGDLNQTEITIFRENRLASGVINMCVYSPYPGETKDGVGIGTSRNLALQKLGQPDFVDENDQRVCDHYIFGEYGFIVEYRADSLFSICMTI